jgi:lipopolysaccharide transport system ATP-binding protein
MKRREITAKFDEIVAFSELDRFIDTPVNRYSSGMYTRLAFAVAAHLEPEILVVDEVLAVGDAEFQKKCLNKMGDVASHGRTVLFVSHNMGAVQTLCRRGVLLSNGQLRMFAPIKDVVAEYLKVNETLTALPLSERRDRSGDGRFRFTDIAIQDADGNSAAFAVTGEDCYVVLKMAPPPPGTPMLSPLDVSVIFRDIHGNKLTELATHFVGTSPATLNATREQRCYVPRLPLLAGQYRLDLWCGTSGETQDYLVDAATLRVEPGNYFRNFDDARLPNAEKNGCIMIPQHWQSV